MASFFGESNTGSSKYDNLFVKSNTGETVLKSTALPNDVFDTSAFGTVIKSTSIPVSYSTASLNTTTNQLTITTNQLTTTTNQLTTTTNQLSSSQTFLYNTLFNQDANGVYDYSQIKNALINVLSDSETLDGTAQNLITSKRTHLLSGKYYNLGDGLYNGQEKFLIKTNNGMIYPPQDDALFTVKANSGNTNHGIVYEIMPDNVDNNILWFFYSGTSWGTFSATGNITNRMIRYNKSTKSFLTFPNGAIHTGTSTRGAFFIDNTDVFVYGDFSVVGNTSTNLTATNIARYNRTTNTWSQVLNGANNGANGLISHIMAHPTLSNTVFVCGNFTTFLGVACNKLAMWNYSTNTITNIGNLTGGTTAVRMRLDLMTSGKEGFWICGDFTGADNAGTGISQGARIVYYNLSTNVLQIAAPHTIASGVVNDCMPSPDGNYLYIGGSFTGITNILSTSQKTCQLNRNTGAYERMGNRGGFRLGEVRRIERSSTNANIYFLVGTQNAAYTTTDTTRADSGENYNLHFGISVFDSSIGVCSPFAASSPNTGAQIGHSLYLSSSEIWVGNNGGFAILAYNIDDACTYINTSGSGKFRLNNGMTNIGYGTPLTYQYRSICFYSDNQMMHIIWLNGAWRFVNDVNMNASLSGAPQPFILSYESAPII